jgi:hypothetical protein
MECEFCNTYLKTLSSLNYHKKSNKKCLEIQNKTDEIFSMCEYCDKKMTIQSLKKHLLICKYKLLKQENELFKQENELLKQENEILTQENEILKQENKLLKQEIINYKFEIDELKKENDDNKQLQIENNEEIKKSQMRIVELEAVNKIYLQDREVVQKLAMQPKTTNTNNNDTRIKINNNFFDNPEIIKQMIDEKLTKDYISEGQKGVAQFACNNLLKDENGNMNYICSDTSRHIFKFQNSEGNIEKDVKANKLTNMLIEAGISNKALSMAPSLWTDEDGNINSNKFLIFSPYTNEISSMQIDNTVFRNELATLTSL